ncbi:DUF3653 domain-containing protein [Stenotrophomonas maltophilia]|uniref:DUF3653 domain-containing protein n=1 Tax=Stenotrophomonas maltophilia TaxID=40324 RepID=UPI0030993996
MIEFDPHHRIDLTGPWAGFSFIGDRLITPEGRELEPQDLAWLSLTACQAQEWRRMMDEMRRQHADPHSSGKPCGTKGSNPPLSGGRAEVVTISTLMANRKKRSASAMAGPDAEPPAAGQLVPGPSRRERV